MLMHCSSTTAPAVIASTTPMQMECRDASSTVSPTTATASQSASATWSS
jgi:hypothetical protein